MTRATTIPDTVTMHVPFHLVKRGGRKEIRLPDDVPRERKTDNTLIKALARAFRWKRMLESGEVTTITELAEREKIAASYLTRVLRLTLLAPVIVETILDGRQSRTITFETLREQFPVEWDQQERWLQEQAQRGLPHDRSGL